MAPIGSAGNWGSSSEGGGGWGKEVCAAEERCGRGVRSCEDSFGGVPDGGEDS